MWVTMGADRRPLATNGSARATSRSSSSAGSMVEAVQAFAGGEPAIGTGDDAIPAKVCAFQAIVPKTVDWRQYDVKPVWETPGPVLEPSYDV